MSGSLSPKLILPWLVRHRSHDDLPYLVQLSRNADRIAHLSVKLAGTGAELRKKIGDDVLKDEVIAVLESREVADAKSDYLAARLTNDLSQDLANRDKTLWDSRSIPEQQYLRSRNAAAQSGMKVNVARQKLTALGVEESAINCRKRPSPAFDFRTSGPPSMAALPNAK